MKKMRQKMCYLDGELIEWYEKKYPARTFSGTINELLRNFLYIQIDENSQGFTQELADLDKKLLEIQQKKAILKSKIEIVEQKKLDEQETLTKLTEEREKSLLKCLICGTIPEENNRVELKGRFMHKSCFNTAPVKEINRIIDEMEKKK